MQICIKIFFKQTNFNKNLKNTKKSKRIMENKKTEKTLISMINSIFVKNLKPTLLRNLRCSQRPSKKRQKKKSLKRNEESQISETNFSAGPLCRKSKKKTDLISLETSLQKRGWNKLPNLEQVQSLILFTKMFSVM